MLKRHLLSKLILASLVLLLASCASIKQASKQPIYADYISENKLEEVKKITSFRFHGWQSLDNHHLILSASFNRPYLISFKNYCNDLDFTNAIIVDSSGSSLQAKFDSIIPARHHSTKCYIDSIHKITREQARQLTSLKASNRAKNKTGDKVKNESKA